MLSEYTLNESAPDIGDELRELLSDVDTATIGHFELIGFVGADVLPVFPSKACGTAVTVAASGRDGAVIYHAIDMLRPGDFLVISRLDRDDIACVGGGVSTAVRAKQGAGIIIDGPGTDVGELEELGLPVWCRGVSAKTSNRQVSIGGAVNVPIACGGAAVLPGYAVLADDDGVFVAPPDRMKAAAARALEKQKRSVAVRAHLEARYSIFDYRD